MAANNDWYQTCRSENLPNICIRMRRKHAQLAWDCISLDSRYEHRTHGDSGTAIGRAMFKTFQQRAQAFPRKAIYMGSAFAGTIDPISPAIARQLADDYFEVLYLATRAQKAAA